MKNYRIPNGLSMKIHHDIPDFKNSYHIKGPMGNGT
jgi:hypothetical protein